MKVRLAAVSRKAGSAAARGAPRTSAKARAASGEPGSTGLSHPSQLKGSSLSSTVTSFSPAA